MKRTEKIEVRVSLEEKQTLTELAKQDGESVSGLIRGLVEKYIALNSASTMRRLPKWQIAAGLIVAALIGHGLTLLPMHLHERGHKSASAPVYMVHGAIDNSAFSIEVAADDPNKELTFASESDNPIEVKFTFTSGLREEDGGSLKISVCETGVKNLCRDAFETKMDVGRSAPSVLGGFRTESGKPIHVFVQEMA